MKWLKKKFILCFAMVFVLLSASDVYAEETDQMPKMTQDEFSLKISLVYTEEDETVRAIPGVTLDIVQVADLDFQKGSVNYHLLSDFESSGISFEGMSVSESVDYAAQLNKIVSKKKLSGIQKTTDKAGQVQYANLKAGIYLVHQTKTQRKDFEELVPFLAIVPFPQKDAAGNQWIYSVEMYPKVEIKRIDQPELGRIEVTKQVQLKAHTKEAQFKDTFYFGIFSDQEGKTPAFDGYLKKVSLNGETRKTIVYSDIPVGTYYVFETDKNGKQLDTKAFPYKIDGNGQKLKLTDSNVLKQVKITNIEKSFVKTGDYIHTAGMVMLFLASLGILCIMMKKRRQR